jgi:hypothetical protein
MNRLRNALLHARITAVPGIFEEYNVAARWSTWRRFFSPRPSITSLLRPTPVGS